VAVILNPIHAYTDIYLSIDEFEDRILNAIDGERRIDSILRRFQKIRQRPFAMMKAYESGIKNLSYASDAGVYLWGENAADLVEFVNRGMPEMVAIQTATVNAAHMLGLDGQLGTIAPGKKADMIATARNPLEDISALMEVGFVMRDGKVFRHDDTVRVPGSEGSRP